MRKQERQYIIDDIVTAKSRVNADIIEERRKEKTDEQRLLRLYGKLQGFEDIQSYMKSEAVIIDD